MAGLWLVPSTSAPASDRVALRERHVDAVIVGVDQLDRADRLAVVATMTPAADMQRRPAGSARRR